MTQLARTLRYTLTAGQEEVVSLERELEIVADYLELESLRLGERLRIERTISVEARVAHIPVMMLQTVVENAIKHGIAELPQGGVLRISAEVRERRADHRSREPAPSVAQPIAVARRRPAQRAERLRLLFGTAGGLDLDLSRPDGRSRAFAFRRPKAGRMRTRHESDDRRR